MSTQQEGKKQSGRGKLRPVPGAEDALPAQKPDDAFDTLVGADGAFLEALAAARRAAKTDIAVLIIGESGTGKEILARAIHRISSRREKPLVDVNCAAIPDTLIESELFGYERGAFTGARTEGRGGYFDEAHGGRFCSTRSATRLYRCSPNCFGCWSRGLLKGWAGRKISKSMCALCPPQNRTWPA